MIAVEDKAAGPGAQPKCRPLSHRWVVRPGVDPDQGLRDRCGNCGVGRFDEARVYEIEQLAEEVAAEMDDVRCALSAERSPGVTLEQHAKMVAAVWTAAWAVRRNGAAAIPQLFSALDVLDPPQTAEDVREREAMSVAARGAISMSSGAISYSVPGLGTIQVNAKDGRVEVKRSIANVEISRVVITFDPNTEEPKIEGWPKGFEGR